MMVAMSTKESGERRARRQSASLRSRAVHAEAKQATVEDFILDLIDARKRGDTEIDGDSDWGPTRDGIGGRPWQREHTDPEAVEADLRALCVKEVRKVYPDWWRDTAPPGPGETIILRPNKEALKRERAAKDAYANIVRAVRLAREIRAAYGDVAAFSDQFLPMMGVGRYAAWLARWGGSLADFVENAPPTGPDGTDSELQRIARMFPDMPARFVAAFAILNGHRHPAVGATSERRPTAAGAIFSKVVEAVETARKVSESPKPRRVGKNSRPKRV